MENVNAGMDRWLVAAQDSKCQAVINPDCDGKLIRFEL